jgi:hypothetical protein
MAVVIEGTPEGYVVAKPTGEVRPGVLWVDQVLTGSLVFSRAQEVAEELDTQYGAGHRIYALIPADV